MRKSTFTASALAMFGLTITLSTDAADWLQFGFDPSHSGTNPAETLIGIGNVQNVHLLYSTTLPLVAPGAPVLLSAISTSKGVKDLLFLTLSDGTTLALDAATGVQIWSQRPTDTAPCATQANPCKTSSSPAIDPNRQFVYAYGLDGYVHKYQVANGTEVTTSGWPELATTKPDVENGASALTFAKSSANGKTYLYMAHSGLLDRDSGDYQGHITAIDVSSGSQIVFNAVCTSLGNIHFVENGNTSGPGQNDCLQQTIQPPYPNAGNPTGDGGIWSRPSAVYDPLNDEIYITTGNGVYSGNNLGDDWSDSVLSLPAALNSAFFAPLDSYTPNEFFQLMYNDTDLGSAAIALIPAPVGSVVSHIGVQAGKDANLRLVNLDNLSGNSGPGYTGGELFVLGAPQTGEVKTQPVTWTDSDLGNIFLIVANNFGISSLLITTDGSGNPQLVNGCVVIPLISCTFGWEIFGNPLATGTSAGGTSPVIANGVLFYAGANGMTALDPASGTTLWNDASMGVSTTSPGIFSRQSPIVVNGRIYVTDQNKKLWAYQTDEIFRNGLNSRPRPNVRQVIIRGE